MPEWLTLRIAGGGLVLNGDGAVHAFVEAPAGTLILNGRARLVGGAICDHLILNGNPLLRLIAAPPANQPPSVALIAPIDGAIFPAPAAINLVANATDADGAIAKVEFLEGTTTLGEVVSPPFQYTVSGLAAGRHVLVARATDNVEQTSFVDFGIAPRRRAGLAIPTAKVDVDLRIGQ